MKIEAYSDRIIKVDEFWDCNCDDDHIHRKIEPECLVCHAVRDDQPDSLLDEILVLFEDLNIYEKAEMVYYLYNNYVI